VRHDGGDDGADVARVHSRQVMRKRFHLGGVVVQDVDEESRVTNQEVNLVNDAPNLALLDHLVEVGSWVVHDFGSMRARVLVQALFNDIAKLSHSRCKSFHSPDGDALDSVSGRGADESGFRHHFRLHDAKERNRQAADAGSLGLRRLRHVIRLVSEPIRLLSPPVVVIGHVVRLVSVEVVRLIGVEVVRLVGVEVVWFGFVSVEIVWFVGMEEIVVCDVV